MLNYGHTCIYTKNASFAKAMVSFLTCDHAIATHQMATRTLSNLQTFVALLLWSIFVGTYMYFKKRLQWCALMLNVHVPLRSEGWQPALSINIRILRLLLDSLQFNLTSIDPLCHHPSKPSSGYSNQQAKQLCKKCCIYIYMYIHAFCRERSCCGSMSSVYVCYSECVTKWLVTNFC